MDNFLKEANRNEYVAASLTIVRDTAGIAISTWYSNYLSELLFLAYQILENEQDAEDIVSGLFEKLIRVANEQKDLASFNSEA